MRERKRTVDLRPTNCFASVLLHTWFIPTERESIDTQPGSLARVLVFCQRLERGEQLFHPADRRCFGAGDEA